MTRTPAPLQREIQSYAVGSFFSNDEEGLIEAIRDSATPMADLTALSEDQWGMLDIYEPFEEDRREDIEGAVEDLYDSVSDLFDRVVSSGWLSEIS